MTYFEKIEAYLSGAMDEMEQSIFEEALAENTVLQKEYEAYQAAQDLFNFTAETLPVGEIVTSSATEMADQLINFAALNLSEQEILGSTETVSTQKETIVRTLKTRKNRMEWFVAASMVFILSVIGSRFYTNNATNTIQPRSEVVVEKEFEPIISTPIEAEKVIPAPVIVDPQEKIVKKIAKRVVKNSKESRKYEPAKVRISPKVIPAAEQQPIASAEKVKESPLPTASTISKPMAVLTKAEKIVTEKVINMGQAVVYKAGNSITLKPGFHAKTGTEFVATSVIENETINDLTKMEVIDQQETVVYNAANTITLKPGFHAKAGSDFVATTNKPSIPPTVSTNMVISENEEIVMKADETVTLKPGFHAKAGADFVAKVKK